MTEEHAKKYCQMESRGNTIWSKAVDAATSDQDEWIQQMEMATALLHSCGLNMAALTLLAADQKITAELFRQID